MSKIIEFSGGSAADRARSRPSAAAFRETPRQRASRRRNPLRQHAERISLAVTIVGKLGRADQLQVAAGLG
jgi:hypothetical protein